MKYFFVALFCILSVSQLYAQDIPTDTATDLYTYRGVVAVEHATKAQLYSRYMLWVAYNYGDVSNFLFYDDKDAGLIVGRGASDIHCNLESDVLTYLIKVELKDGRYRYTLTQMYYGDTKLEAYSWRKKVVLPAVNTELQNIIRSLNKAMATEEDDKW